MILIGSSKRTTRSFGIPSGCVLWENIQALKCIEELVVVYGHWICYKRLRAATEAMRAALEAEARTVVPTADRQEVLR